MRTKANNWGNIDTGQIVYGIDVWAKTERAPMGEWCHAAENGKPLVFTTEAAREAKRKEVRRWTGDGMVISRSFDAVLDTCPAWGGCTAHDPGTPGCTFPKCMPRDGAKADCKPPTTTSAEP